MTSIVTTLKGKVLRLEIVLPEKVCGHQTHLCALKQAGLLLAYAKVTTVMPGVLGIIARRSLSAGVLIQTRTLQCTNVTPIARLKSCQGLVHRMDKVPPLRIQITDAMRVCAVVVAVDPES